MSLLEKYEKGRRVRGAWWNDLIDRLAGRRGLVLPASYVIFKETINATDYYLALNAKIGNIDFGGQNNAGKVDGTNASAVIQAVINTLTGGGKIFIKAGDYSLSETLLVKFNNLVIAGEGRRTHLKLDGIQTVISLGTSSDCVVRELSVDAGGINISEAVNPSIVRCWINGILTNVEKGTSSQMGEVKIEAETASLKSGTCSFGITFPKIPYVQTTIEKPTPPSVDWGRVWADKVTKSQFTWFVEIMQGQVNGKVYLIWKAQV